MKKFILFEITRGTLAKRIIFIVILLMLFFFIEKYSVDGKTVKAQGNTEICIENSAQEKIEDDNDFFFGISLKDIINSAIGAFLGFWASLVLQKRATSANKRKSINNIIAELETIRDGIRGSVIAFIPDSLKSDISNNLLVEEVREDKKAVIGRIDKKIREMVYVIYLPIWETVLQTGDILEFKDQPYFDTMILIYTKIYRLKALIESYYKEEKNMLELTAILKECLELDVLFSDSNSSITKLLGTK